MKKKFLAGGALFTALVLLGSGVYFYNSLPKLRSYEQVKTQYQSSDLYILSHDGKLLHQWRKNKDNRSFQWTPLADISPVLISEVLKSEDRFFYEHTGVSITSLVASLYQRSFKDSSRGGSTITMQLLKLIAPDRAQYSGMTGKLRQILSAYRLEKSWTKKEILESYLNLIPLRGEYKGVTSSSWALFNKSPSGLTLKEAVALAVLIRSPNAGVKDWKNRACWQEPSLCSEFPAFIAELAKKTLESSTHNVALHLAQRLSPHFVSGEIKSTVHMDVQTYTQEVVKSQIQNLQAQNVNDAAVLVVENATGNVWAYIGGSGISDKKFVDGVRSYRQAGSTLKPFLYATAFENNILTPNSWIEDSAVDIVFERGIYKPQNHDKQFYGWVQVKTALASSLNVPAVKVFKLLNDESFWTRLQMLGFKNLKEPEHYGPALALGVADVTLEDLTQAYRTLANNGIYTDLRFTSNDPEPKARQVFKAQTAQDVAYILAQSENRALGFGLDSALSTQGASVKTGTSKDMRDNWCVGFNSRFTVGVWVGNFSGDPMWNVMGVTGAAPIWKKVMAFLDANYPSAKLSLASAQKEITPPEKYPQARIVYPQDGMIMALDPAIPRGHQKMPLLAEGPHPAGLQWKINGKKVAGNKSILWTPETGRHTFELYQNQKLAQKVQVLVK
ncbi:penicillin-binding protein 1C [Bdellovibrio bacteriovorus]|uniref:peptidoglycan glycosyltransferase n=1 Tax=Bdellovibrio bacteriovorus TaxID=959 RepID=A0A150WD40_BDEBC|nr:penicillin-binding protein 1C [Bdellovibrio bacteriovorus]KYG60829.1 penicillin-binding protein 1C [Bdellovibrio bacteriovorus]